MLRPSQLLLAGCCWVDRVRITRLHLAALYNHYGVAEIRIAAGADLDAKDDVRQPLARWWMSPGQSR